MIEADPALVERLVARRVRELMDAHQRLTEEPDHVVERSGVLVDDRLRAEQLFVPGDASTKVAHRQGDVRDCGELSHSEAPRRERMDRTLIVAIARGRKIGRGWIELGRRG